MRCAETPILLVKRYFDMPSGTKNFSSSISPGDTGAIIFLILLICNYSCWHWRSGELPQNRMPITPGSCINNSGGCVRECAAQIIIIQYCAQFLGVFMRGIPKGIGHEAWQILKRHFGRFKPNHPSCQRVKFFCVWKRVHVSEAASSSAQTMRCANGKTSSLGKNEDIGET